MSVSAFPAKSRVDSTPRVLMAEDLLEAAVRAMTRLLQAGGAGGEVHRDGMIALRSLTHALADARLDRAFAPPNGEPTALALSEEEIRGLPLVVAVANR